MDHALLSTANKIFEETLVIMSQGQIAFQDHDKMKVTC